MAVSGTLIMSGTLVDAGVDISNPNPSWTFTNGVSGGWSGSLASGDNVFTLPVGCTMIRIIMPPLNSIVTGYRFTGSTNQPMHPSIPIVLTVPTASPPTALTLNSASAQTSLTTVIQYN